MEKKERFSDSLLNSIELEKLADSSQTSELLSNLSPKALQKKRLAILNLITSSLRTGLGGKSILELSLDPAVNNTEEIENGELRVGDIVQLSKLVNTSNLKASKKAIAGSSKKDKLNEGNSDSVENSVEAVIIRLSLKSISLSIEENFEDKLLNLINERLWLVKVANSITYKRMESTLRKLKEIENPSYLMQMLLGDAKYVSPNRSDLTKLKDSDFFDGNLNASQRTAVNFATGSSLSIIHGPPGTGKTYTLIEIIRQLVKTGERVLVCGPSNISVDTILERLHGKIEGNKLVRIGHPARLLQANLQHSLDILSKTSDNGGILNDIRSDIDSTLIKIKKAKRYQERKQLWNDLKDFKKELKQREKKIVNGLILDSKVVVSTLHGAGARELTGIYKDGIIENNSLFDTIIIDEVSQSLEAQCWIPIVSHLGVKRLILAGDNQQLPPTIKIDNNAKVKKHLETTIFDRLVKIYGDQFKKLLNVQYRMNTPIMKFSSQELYQDQLIAHESVANHKLSDLDNSDVNDDTNIECIWFDTQGDDFPEKSSEEDNGSKYNEMEVLLVQKHIESLVESNIQQEQIGVISPYNAQVTLLKSSIHSKYPNIEISSIDGFQGREKECIIISLVRSNDSAEIGFLKDERRLNVAITRPRRQLCVIGDMETLSRSNCKFIKHWCDYVEDNYEIRYPDLTDY